MTMILDFMTRIEKRALKLNTRVCVGIDPHPEFVSTVHDLEDWALQLAHATAPFAACFKINIAFFGCYQVFIV